MPACFPISNYELRPAQVTGNCKYLHGNNPTFHRSRLSWVRSHNETMNNALHTPFAAITEIWFCHSAWLLTNMWGLCRFSRVRSVILAILWASEPFSANWKFSGTTRKSGAATGKYKLLPARSYWRLLRTGKMIFQALFKTSLRKSESNLPVNSSTSMYLVFVPQKNPRMNIIMYQFNPN